MANEFKVKNGLIVVGDVTTSGTITINGALAATQSWVTSQSYLTSANLSGYATQSYVTSAIASLVDSAPAALDTLKELATALGNDASFSTTVTNSIAGKMALYNGVGAPDFNTNTTNGIYRNQGGANAPVSAAHFTMFSAFQPDGNYGWQLAASASDSLYFRFKDANFNSWVQLATRSWVTSQNYLTSYTDTLATVTSRGASTSTPVTFNGNVTLGNNADLVFQDLSGTFPTTGKGFDWTLNNDGARIYAYQPNSDSIDFVFQLRDNATTNDRFVFWVDEWQGPAYDKYPLIISGGTQFDLKDSALYTNSVLRLSNSGVLQNVTGNISMFTNNVGYLTSYTETDTLSSVVARGATTSNSITVGGITVSASNVAGITLYDTLQPYGWTIRTNGTNLYFVDNGGNNLAVLGSSGVFTLGSGYAKTINFYPNHGTTKSRISGGYGNGYLDFGGIGYGNITKLSDNEIQVGSDAYPQLFSMGSAGTSLNIGSYTYSLKSGSTTYLFASTSGLIGIGLTTPQKKLDVYGTGIVASFGGTFSPGDFAGIHFGYSESNLNNDSYKKSALVFERTDNHNQGGNASGKIHFLLNNAGGSSATALTASVVTIDSDANGTVGSVRMGIGTTSPSTKLEVGNFLDAVTNKITVAARYEYEPEFNFRLGQSGTNYDWIGAVISSGDDGNYNGKISFKTANANRDTPTTKMVIKASGNVGIGTTSPNYKLDVNGSINIYSGNSLRWGSGDAEIINSGYNLLFKTYNGSALAEAMRINSAGKVSIGTTDTNSDKSDFTVYTGGTTTLALSGNLLRVGDTDVNWSVALRSNGVLETYGQNLYLGSAAGNYPVTINPNGTNSVSFYPDYTLFNGLNLAISRTNSTHGAANYFRGDSSHLVIGTGGTLYLNYGGGNTIVTGTVNITGGLTVAQGIGQNNLVGRPYAVWGANGTTTGAVVIKFPGNTSNYGMVHAVIDIYEYSGNHVSTVIVGGHNWGGSQWYNYGANLVGQTDKQVRVAIVDGAYAIVIGDNSSSWSYGQVVLRKIQNGSYYANAMNVSEGYTVTQTASLSPAWISGDLRQLTVSGVITASGGNSNNWNTAYNWGNHSSLYLPLGGGTLTGDLNLNYGYPRINFYDSGNNPDYSLINNDGDFSLYDITNNIHRLWVSAVGNVGIGNTSPTEALSISGSSTSGVGIRLANGDGIGGRILADNSSLYFYSNNGTLVYSLNNSKIRLNDGGGGTIGVELGSNGSISQNGNGGGLTFSDTTAYLSNGLIVTAGNVGIGTSSPSEKLHVSGAAIFDGGAGNSSTDSVVYITKSNNNDWGLYVNASGLDYGMYTRVSPSAGYAFAIHDGSNWTTRITGNAIIYLGEKDAIRGNYDSWLRLNNSNHYTSGVYTPGVMRADGGFYVSGNTVIHSGTIGSQSVSYATSAGSASTATDGLRLLREDNRTISPSELAAGYLKFGFTSWTNDNSGPYADFLHLRSYTDASGGNDNLVMFLKSGIGMRIYQQTFGSASAYSSYADVWTSANFTSTNVSNWNTAYGWGNHASAGYLTSLPSHNHDDRYYTESESDSRFIRKNTWEGNAYIGTGGDIYGTVFFDSNNSAYYVDPNSNSNINNLSVVGYQSIGGQTSNGQSNYQWDGADYRNPDQWTARLILRRDNATTGINGSIPSLVIFNNNGANQTTASMVFATNECATGSNSVNLAGIIAKKESVGNCGGWSSGSLNFFVKNFGARVDSLALTPDGNATFSGIVYSTGYGNSSQWNIAYGWGNHASQGYATTSYVTTQINNLINGAPGALDTLSELASALGNDASFATTVTNSIAGKVSKSGDTITGKITFPSSVSNRPQFPGGVLGIDTGDGEFDIWGISRDYYPSHPTAANAWGLEWYGIENQFRFVGAGSRVITLDMDNGIISTISHGNSTQWNTAYGWGNHASAGYALNSSLANYLPLAGGTMTGALTIQNGPTATWDYMTLEHPGPYARINLGNAENGFLIAHEGTTTATFATNGNLTITGALIETSSIKVKENVETSEGNLEKVVNLRPVTYNKIGSQTTELGLIAEEVAEVYPEFVQYDENGEPVGVHYSRLTAALIGAVKELNEQLQELKRNK